MTYKWLVHTELRKLAGGNEPRKAAPFNTRRTQRPSRSGDHRLPAIDLIRMRGNKANLIDGPFTETKEVLASTLTNSAAPSSNQAARALRRRIG